MAPIQQTTEFDNIPIDPLTQAWLAQLQQTWHQTIPVSQFMQITPNDFNGTRFTAIAPLAPNINLHHTMFAGSIYTLMTLTGWGMVWLQQKRQGITADIVLADGKIKYHAPVTEAPVSQVMWPAPTKAQLDSQIESQAIERSILNSDFTDLYRCNKMSHHLEVHLYSGKTLCATFNGRYVSLKKPI